MSQPQIALLGECMLEFSPAGTGPALYTLAVAGDTYNTAVALSHLGCRADYLTGLGRDRHSDFIISTARQQGLGTDNIMRFDGQQPGLYLIDNDATGERYFSYWRAHSAAHHCLRDPQFLLPLLERVAASPYLYLTGISLALCEAQGRQVLGPWLARYRDRGGRVIYDSNYRPALWTDLASAQSAHAELLKHTDIFLPGADDEFILSGLKDKSALTDLLLSGPAPEVVLKNGAGDINLIQGQGVRVVAPHPVPRVVDATGAGDAFNGAYLAARLQGLEMEAAAQFAASVAAATIAHRGAILPTESWQQLHRALQQLLQ